MKNLTKYEWQIICLFTISLFFREGYTWKFFATFYCLGMVFEWLTQKMWDYNDALFFSPLTIPGKDVNFIFALGWIALIILGVTVGKYITLSPLLQTILGVLIVGNILETLYHYLGLFTYNYDVKILGMKPNKFCLPFDPIPLSVRVGYALNGLGAYYLIKLVN